MHASYIIINVQRYSYGYVSLYSGVFIFIAILNCTEGYKRRPFYKHDTNLHYVYTFFGNVM